MKGLPGGILLVVIGTVGVCGVPAAVFFAAIGLGGPTRLNQPLVMGVMGLVAYPLAFWLWHRTRQTVSTTRAWLLATVGVLLVVGASLVPVTILYRALTE